MYPESSITNISKKRQRYHLDKSLQENLLNSSHISAKTGSNKISKQNQSDSIRLPSIIFNSRTNIGKHRLQTEHSSPDNQGYFLKSSMPMISSLADVEPEENVYSSPRAAITNLPSSIDELDESPEKGDIEKRFKILSAVLKPHTMNLLQMKRQKDGEEERRIHLVAIKKLGSKTHNKSVVDLVGKRREEGDTLEKRASFDKIIKEFHKLVESSMMVYTKWSNESIKQDNQASKGAVIRVLQVFSLESQIYLLTMIKLQKIVEGLERLDLEFENQLVTQISLKPLLSNLAITASQTMMYEVIIYYMMFIGRTQKYLCDYAAAVRTFYKLRIITDLFCDTKNLQRSYFELGECHKSMGEFKIAEEYFEMFLHNSWFIEDRSGELRGYDMIGICLYYQNKLEKARKFHQRSLNTDSALENKEFNLSIKTRFKEEETRKLRVIGGKDPFYRVEVMRDLIEYDGEIDFFLKVKGIHVFLNSNFSVDTLSTLVPEVGSTKNSKGSKAMNKPVVRHHIKPVYSNINSLNKESRPYIANFTVEGYANSIKNSNPIKYSMIKGGIMKVEEDLTKDVPLKEGDLSKNEKFRYLSHLSPNNSKHAFTMVKQDAEVCLQFFKKNSKDVMRSRIKLMKDQALEDIEIVIQLLSVSKDNRKKSIVDLE